MNLRNLPFRRKLRFASFVLSLLLLNSCASLMSSLKEDNTIKLDAKTEESVQKKSIYATANISPYTNGSTALNSLANAVDLNTTLASPKFGTLGISYQWYKPDVFPSLEQTNYDLNFNRNSFQIHYGFPLWNKKITTKNTSFKLYPKDRNFIEYLKEYQKAFAIGPTKAYSTLNLRLGYDQLFSRKSNTDHLEYLQNNYALNPSDIPLDITFEDVTNNLKVGLGFNIFKDTYISGSNKGLKFIGLNTSLLRIYLDAKYALNAKTNLRNLQFSYYDENTMEYKDKTETVELSSFIDYKNFGLTLGVDYSCLLGRNGLFNYVIGAELSTYPGYLPGNYSNFFAQIKIAVGLGKMFNLK